MILAVTVYAIAREIPFCASPQLGQALNARCSLQNGNYGDGRFATAVVSYKVVHSEHSQLSKPTIQKQMDPEASWMGTMYGYMDGCAQE